VIDRTGELLDETTLRRALRLEADERPPRFDPAAIAAAARQRPGLALVSAFVAVVLGVTGAAAAWSLVALFAPTFIADALDLLLARLALFAIPASAVAELIQQPVIPLSLVVALAIATAHELRERVVHATAS
jgi:hypothetical protein